MSGKQKKETEGKQTGNVDPKDEWTSIKIREETRGKLRDFGKDIGVGVGEAVKILIEAKEQAIAGKIADIDEIASELGDILLSSGLFDIKFRGGGVDNIKTDDSCLIIHGFIRVEIPDEAARENILKLMTEQLQEKEVIDNE